MTLEESMVVAYMFCFQCTKYLHFMSMAKASPLIHEEPHGFIDLFEKQRMSKKNFFFILLTCEGL